MSFNNVRRSQATILIVTYKSLAFNFIFPFPDKFVDKRIKFFDQLFRTANERYAKHEFWYYKRLYIRPGFYHIKLNFAISIL